MKAMHLSQCNPYVGNSPAGASPFGTKTLKGVPKERKKSAGILFEAYKSKGEVPLSHYTDFYGFLCDDIIRERNKIGGNWVIAQGVYKRRVRDFIREKLGPDCTFIGFSMKEDLQLRRLALRTLGSGSDVTEAAIEEAKQKYKGMAISKGYEDVEDGENNAHALEMTEFVTSQDAVKFILEKV